MLGLVECWICGLTEVLCKSCCCPCSHSLCSGLKQSQANGFSDLCEVMMSNKNPVQSHLHRSPGVVRAADPAIPRAWECVL